MRPTPCNMLTAIFMHDLPCNIHTFHGHAAHHDCAGPPVQYAYFQIVHDLPCNMRTFHGHAEHRACVGPTMQYAYYVTLQIHLNLMSQIGMDARCKLIEHWCGCTMETCIGTDVRLRRGWAGHRGLSRQRNPEPMPMVTCTHKPKHSQTTHCNYFPGWRR